MTEVFAYTSKGKSDTETTKYIKVTEKPTAPYKKQFPNIFKLKRMGLSQKLLTDFKKGGLFYVK